jgi:hypothetical protein
MMAGFADKEYLRDVDPDQPIDGAASPQAAPESPSAVPAPDEAPPARHAPGSSTPPNLLDLGTTINNGATSSLVGDVWQNGSEGGGKVSGSATPDTNDLVAAHSGLLAELNTGQFSGAALGHVQAILSDITTAISAANASASGGGTPGAELALRASHLSILNTVSTDPVLANPAAQNGVTEPIAAPEAVPADTTAATAPDANSAETTNLAETGDTENTAQTDENLDAAIAEMEALIAANPDLFVGLTVDDADEIVQQIQLELSHINKGDVPLGAAQEGNNDITDIVTGDINLASMTVQGQPNSPGQQAVNIVGAGETQASPQVATIAIGDVPVTIVTTEAPTIVVDDSHSGAPEYHLHHTWG